MAFARLTTRTSLFAAAVAAVVLYGLLVLIFAGTSREIGVRTLLTNETDPEGVLGVEIQQADAGLRQRVRPGWRENVPEEGDWLIEIGGRPVPSYAHFSQRIRQLRSPEIFGAAYVYSDDGRTWVHARYLSRATGQERETWLEVRNVASRELVLSLVWFILQLGVLGVGVVVYWWRPEDASVRLFVCLCAVTAAAFVGGFNWWVIAEQPWLLYPWAVSAMLLPPLSLHFYLVFPSRKRFVERHPRLTLAAVYAVPALAIGAILYLLGRLGWLVYTGQPPLQATATLDLIRRLVYAYLSVAGACFAMTLAALVHSLRTARSLIERRQVQWVLSAGAVAAVPVGYTLYLASASPVAFALGQATWPMFIASLSIMLAHAMGISRYKLMQVERLLSRGAMHVAISIGATAVYCATVAVATLLVGRYLRWVELSRHALSVAVTVMVLSLLLSWIRMRFQQALDRRFHREKYQLDKAMQRMSQAVHKLVGPQALAKRMLESARDALGASGGAIYLRQQADREFVLAAAVGTMSPRDVLPAGILVPAEHRHRSRGKVVGWKVAPSAEPVLAPLGGELVQGLELEGDLRGVVILGPKVSRTPYTTEDRTFLSALAGTATLALESAQGHRRIEELNAELQGKVEKIAEQQRRITALQNQLLTRDSSTSVSHEAAAPPAEPAPFDRSEIVGSSAAVHRLLGVVRKVAASPSAVLIRGESGTGKEVFARAVHANSPRRDGPFVQVHCAALSAGLLESELFGHVKGAFTGAHRDKVGRFEMADRGTLFLDEIGDINLETQTKLLRVLQEMAFERVGGTETLHVDVRLITATHQPLEELIRAGRFREDLYYRLNVISIEVPPLRERKEDVAELALHFLSRYAASAGKRIATIDEAALDVLLRYPWPGNIRELENTIERAVVLCDGPAVTLADLPPEIVRPQPAPERLAKTRRELWAMPAAARFASAASAPTSQDGTADACIPADADRAPPDANGPAPGLAAQLDDVERRRIAGALDRAAGNKAHAARILGIPRSTLVSKLKKYGMG